MCQVQPFNAEHTDFDRIAGLDSVHFQRFLILVGQIFNLALSNSSRE